jgi:hypothetical protein
MEGAKAITASYESMYWPSLKEATSASEALLGTEVCATEDTPHSVGSSNHSVCMYARLIGLHCWNDVTVTGYSMYRLLFTPDTPVG